MICSIRELKSYKMFCSCNKKPHAAGAPVNSNVKTLQQNVSSLGLAADFNNPNMKSPNARNRKANSGVRVALSCVITSEKLEALMDFRNSTPEQVKKIFPAIKTLMPSFCKTASTGFSYHVFFAFNFDDAFFSENPNGKLFLNALNEVIKEVCAPRHVKVEIHLKSSPYSGNPTWAQNDAMMRAYLMNMDYYYRINDDTIFTSKHWTENFIEALQSVDPPNVGVVGPLASRPGDALMCDFVHQTHIEIFGFYYPREIEGEALCCTNICYISCTNTCKSHYTFITLS